MTKRDLNNLNNLNNSNELCCAGCPDSVAYPTDERRCPAEWIGGQGDRVVPSRALTQGRTGIGARKASVFTTVLAAAMALGAASACGPADETDLFAGTWQVTGGVVTMTCSGYASTSTFQGIVTFLKSGEGSLVRTEAGSYCTFRFAMGENGPVLAPGQSCVDSGTDEYGYGYTATYRPVTWTVQEVSEGTLHEQYTIILTYLSDGMAETCTLNATGNLVKLGD